MSQKELESEFYNNTVALAECRKRINTAIKRHNKEDRNGNEVMAAIGLSDVHKELEKEDALLKRGRELMPLIGKDRADYWCQKVADRYCK